MNQAFISNINPATAKEISKIPETSSQELERVLDKAQEAFASWSKMPATARGRILKKAANILRTRNNELAHLEVLDTGKPIAEASTVDILSGADALEYFGGIAASIHGEHHNLGESFVYTRREPLGVCAGIGAWNYPLQIACWKAAPALACGNTMVFKPSPLTPTTAECLAEVFRQAGLPEGVFQVVQGSSHIGQHLSRHPSIRKISVTGSTQTGKKVMQEAAMTLKQVTLELGGKSPLLIFADTDLDQAVSAALLANFYTQGEICTNGTRVFVERSIEQAFLDKLVTRTLKMRIGNPLDPLTDIGPMISEEHREKVISYIQKGLDEGACLLAGGITKPQHLSRTEFATGYYVQPTIFSRCQDQMSIVQEEIFGPVMSVLTFDSEEEALERANASDFGLAAGVMTRDLKRAHRVAHSLQAGVCWINNYNVTPVEVPFGGYKESGLGRENGLAALDYYSQRKTVYVEMGSIQAPY